VGGREEASVEEIRCLHASSGVGDGVLRVVTWKGKRREGKGREGKRKMRESRIEE
jgi:hypothetical protein